MIFAKMKLQTFIRRWTSVRISLIKEPIFVRSMADACLAIVCILEVVHTHVIINRCLIL